MRFSHFIAAMNIHRNEQHLQQVEHHIAGLHDDDIRAQKQKNDFCDVGQNRHHGGQVGDDIVLALRFQQIAEFALKEIVGDAHHALKQNDEDDGHGRNIRGYDQGIYDRQAKDGKEIDNARLFIILAGGG